MAGFGVIFDWDGVVIDSSRAHERSWELLAAEVRRPLPAGHFKAGFGRKNEHIIPHILGWDFPPDEVVAFGRRKEEIYRGVLAEQGIEALPGAAALLARLQAAGVPCAVGSSTERRNIDTIMGLIGFAPYFRAIISADDVTRGKPDPQVFLLAAAAIGVAPERCVVFEDSLAGLEAARAGGMKSVGVATTHPPENLAGHADRVVRRLDELTAADLARLAGAAVDGTHAV